MEIKYITEIDNNFIKQIAKIHADIGSMFGSPYIPSKEDLLQFEKDIIQDLRNNGLCLSI